MPATVTDSLTVALGSVLDRTGVLLPLAILGTVVLACIYHDRVAFTKPRRPGVYWPANALPLLGHTVQVIKLGTSNELDTALDFSRRSPVSGWSLSILTQGNLISLSRPEYIEAIQKTNFDAFEKGDFFRDRFADVLGRTGIFVADGTVWKHARKTASHIFSAGQFRNWVQVVVHEELDKVIDILNQVAASSSSSSSNSSVQEKSSKGQVIVLPEVFFRYTLNSFSRMAFSSDIGCLTHDASCLNTPVDFATAFDYAQGVINERILTPAFQLVEYFTPKGKKMRNAVETIRNFAGTIIDERLRNARDAKRAEDATPRPPTHQGGSIAQLAKKDGKDLLDLFMETTHDREELLIVVLNFLIAGRDTTAQLLSWFFYELIAHPEHADLIRRELYEVLGEVPEQGYRLPYDRMRDLPYTFACMTEALRLHPSVPKNGKRCVKDTLLVPAGPNPSQLPPIQVYKGEMVGWSDWVMARLPEVWGADCEEYKPSRFLEEEGGASGDGSSGPKRSVRQYSQWQQHMFNGGPRLCLGMNLANYEALSIIAAILPLFDPVWATHEQGQTASWPPKYVSSITHPMEPYKVVFRRRR